MYAYVDKGTLKVGDEVVLELRTSRGEFLSVVQASKIFRVNPVEGNYRLNEVQF